MSFSPVRPPVVSSRPLAAAGLVVAAWGVFLAVVTVVRWPVLSWSVGATCLGTVYQAVNAVPTVLFDIAAGCAVASVVVPMVVGSLGHGRARDVSRVESAVLTWTVLVLGLCSIGVGVAARPLASALVGDIGCTGAAEAATDMVRWFAPQPLLLGAGLVLGGILRAHRRPLAAAAGPALAALVSVGTLLAFRVLASAGEGTGVSGSHLAVLAGGTTLAALVLAAVPALLGWREGLTIRPTFRLPRLLAGESRGVAQAWVLTVLAQLFGAVAAIVVASRSGVGVLPVYAYVQGTLLLAYAALLWPLVGGVVRRLAGVPMAPEGPLELDQTVVLTRSARHRKPATVGTLAGQARAAVALGAIAGSALGAAAGSVGAFFGDLDRARETALGRLALEALTPGLWSTAPTLVLLGLAAVLSAALYVRGRPFVAGGAIAAAWLIAGGIPLVAVMPGATPAWTLVALGAAAVAGLTVATLDLLAATSRAWGPGALAGLGRTVVVGLLGAAVGAVAGVLVDQRWTVSGLWANAGVAIALAVLGALVTLAVLAAFDRDVVRRIWEPGRADDTELDA
jgi:putative peptidoglycan lipid II flippase